MASVMFLALSITFSFVIHVAAFNSCMSQPISNINMRYTNNIHAQHTTLHASSQSDNTATVISDLADVYTGYKVNSAIKKTGLETYNADSNTENIDDTSYRRKIQSAIIRNRRHSFTLENELRSLLRISGTNSSRLEVTAIHRLSSELESLQVEGVFASAAAAKVGISSPSTTGTNAGGGVWLALYTEDGNHSSNVLRRVLRRNNRQDLYSQHVTYASQHMRISRGPKGELFVYCRDCSPADDCSCSDNSEKNCTNQWVWPL